MIRPSLMLALLLPALSGCIDERPSVSFFIESATRELVLPDQTAHNITVNVTNTGQSRYEFRNDDWKLTYDDGGYDNPGGMICLAPLGDCLTEPGQSLRIRLMVGHTPEGGPVRMVGFRAGPTVTVSPY